MRRLRSGRAKTSWFFRFLSEKGFWALDRAWKFRRGTRIRTNSRKSRTASIPAALDFRTPPGHPPLEKSRAGRRTTTHCCESAYRQLHFWDRGPFSPSFIVTKKWLPRSLYKAQNKPWISITSRKPAITVRVDSSSINCCCSCLRGSGTTGDCGGQNRRARAARPASSGPGGRRRRQAPNLHRRI